MRSINSCLERANTPAWGQKKNPEVSSPGLGFPYSQEESLGCSTKALARRPTEVTVDSADGINQLLFGARQYPHMEIVRQQAKNYSKLPQINARSGLK